MTGKSDQREPGGHGSDRVARRYAAFAEKEAKGRSPLYADLACRIARDRSTLTFLAQLPVAKQQPNLLFAALRHVCGTPGTWQEFHQLLDAHKEQIAEVMLARSTQTNEPARCATLLPVLASLPQPLALLEVGASAGLCLIPDRYDYTYGEHRLHAQRDAAAEPPAFRCAASADTPLPLEVPRIVWRGGLDLNPIDVNDANQIGWLETLVWPGEEDRLANLRAALRVAREDPPVVVRGDLRTDLPALAAQSPAGATLVVFHTAVLAYIPRADRIDFRDTVRALGVTWICNESADVISDMIRTESKPSIADGFLMSVNERPVAWTDPHGRCIEWIG
jgi:hypothetical protein